MNYCMQKSLLLIFVLIVGQFWMSRLFAADSKWAMGVVVGAGVGAVGGAGLGYAFSPFCEENKSQCQWQLPLFAGGVLAVTGGIIGAFVGSMISDEENFAVAPIIEPDSVRGTTFGLNVTIW